MNYLIKAVNGMHDEGTTGCKRQGTEDSATSRIKSQECVMGIPVILLVLGCCFLELFGLMSIRSTLALYLSFVGISTFHIGIITTILTVSSLVTRPLIGRAIDEYGTKQIFVFSGIMVAFVAISHRWVSSFPSAVMLVVAIGIAHGSLMTTATALFLLQSRGQKEDLHMVNLSGLNVMLVTAVAPAAALSILDTQGFSTLHYLVCALALAGLGIFRAISQVVRSSIEIVDKKRAPMNWQIIFSKPFMTCCVAYITETAPSGAIMIFLPLYGKAIGVGNVGLFFTTYAVIHLIVRLFVPALMEKLGRKRLIVISLSLVCLGMIGLCRFDEVKDLIIPAILHGLGTSAVYAPLASQVIDCIPARHKMTGMSIFMSNVEIGQAVGAILIGAFADSMSYSRVFAIMGVVPIIGIVVVLLGSPDPKKLLRRL